VATFSIILVVVIVWYIRKWQTIWEAYLWFYRFNR